MIGILIDILIDVLIVHQVDQWWNRHRHERFDCSMCCQGNIPNWFHLEFLLMNVGVIIPCNLGNMLVALLVKLLLQLFHIPP